MASMRRSFQSIPMRSYLNPMFERANGAELITGSVKISLFSCTIPQNTISFHHIDLNICRYMTQKFCRGQELNIWRIEYMAGQYCRTNNMLLRAKLMISVT